MRFAVIALVFGFLSLVQPSYGEVVEQVENKKPTLAELRQKLRSRPPIMVDNSKQRETFKLGTEVIQQKGTHGLTLPFLFSKNILFGNYTTADNEKKDFFADNYSTHEYSVSQDGGARFNLEFALVDK